MDFLKRLFIFYFLAFCPLAPLRADVATESELKAAFLYNFARFTEWPKNAFPESTSPMVIAVAGTTALADGVAKKLANQVINDRPVVVKKFPLEGPVPDSHILYIPISEEAHVDCLLEEVRDRPTLTVGETRRFSKRGGMVFFYNERNRVRFAVNLKAIQRASLKLSSQMLQYARIIK